MNDQTRVRMYESAEGFQGAIVVMDRDGFDLHSWQVAGKHLYIVAVFKRRRPTND